MPHTDPIVCAELTEMKHAIEAIGEKMDNLNLKLKMHIECENETQRTIADLVSAFPDGPTKHREAHEEMIAAMRKQQAFWDSFWDEAKKKGLFLLFAGVIGMLLIGFKIKLVEWMMK